MPEQSPARSRAVMLVVLGIAFVVLLAFLLIGLLLDDDTDQIDPQNSEIVTHVRR